TTPIAPRPSSATSSYSPTRRPSDRPPPPGERLPLPTRSGGCGGGSVRVASGDGPPGFVCSVSSDALRTSCCPPGPDGPSGVGALGGPPERKESRATRQDTRTLRPEPHALSARDLSMYDEAGGAVRACGRENCALRLSKDHENDNSCWDRDRRRGPGS